MIRRSLVLLLASALALGWATTTSGRSAAQAPSKPNIVLVLTDDQRWDSIGRCDRSNVAGGFDPADITGPAFQPGPGLDLACMPNLRQTLMANGTTFTRGHVTTSLCCPSRAGILTGQYSRHNGVTENDTSFTNLRDASTLATWLHDAGYRTGLIGKYLNSYGLGATTPANYVPPGWDSWHAFWNIDFSPNQYTDFSLVEREPGESAQLVSYQSAETEPTEACVDGNNFSTDLFCNKALDFVDGGPASQPFFLYLATNAPHAPFGVPPRWLGAYDGVTCSTAPCTTPGPPPRYPNVNQVPAPDTPSYLPASPVPEETLDDWRTTFRLQLASARAVDDAIGALWQKLLDQGRLDNTVWVFLSDNGLARGEHSYDRKLCEFEECHRVPFIVACPPSVCAGATPHVDTAHAVLNIDLGPTLAALAGATPTIPVDGTSLLPLLSGNGAGWRTWYTFDDQKNASQYGIVEDRVDGHTYKYVEYANPNSPLRELFDLTVDPWELDTRAGGAQYEQIKTAMAADFHTAIDPPVITITGGPQGTTPSTSATFIWSSNESAAFECTLDAAPFEPCGSGASGSRSYTALANGSHTFKVRGTDADHNVSTPVTRTFNVQPPPPDTTPPTVTMTAPAVDALLTSTAVSAAWSGSDNVGVVRYDVKERIGTGGAQTVVQSSTATTYVRTGTPGTTYCYQVTAVDAANNQRTGTERCAAVPLDDRAVSIAYAGTVTRPAEAGAYLGTVTVMDAAGEKATLSFTGRKVGILMRKGPAAGKAKIVLDGVSKGLINLYASTTSSVYVFQQALAAGSHTISVSFSGKKVAASSSTKITLDGIAFVG